VEVDGQLDALRDGTASMAFVRDLPDDAREGLHHIPLYREVPVVVVNREHPVAAYDEIPLADLADEIVLDDPDLDTRTRVETVAAGTGVVFLPMSVARVHHRKDVVAVPVDGLPESQIGLAWRTDDRDPRLETFIGIVRGRTARSSRGTTPAPATRKPTSRDRATRRSGGRRHRR
jgi:DNA-binding transcriptional LysR family regulator